MHSWQGGGLISTVMITVTTDTKTTTTMNEYTNGKNNDNLIL